MKRLLVATAALSIMAAPALSYAQEHHDDHGGGGRPASQGAPAAPRAQPQAQQFHQPQGGGGAPRPQFQAPQGGFHPQGQAQPQFVRPQGPAQPQFQGRPQFQGQPGGRPAFQGQPGARPQGFVQPQAQGGRPQGNFRQGAQGQNFRGPRPGGQQFSVGGRSFFRYRAEAYRFPYQYRGYDHHYWRRGEFLPSVFFLPNYYIDDYWAYNLWEPDYGYQWIRVGADALLVNLSTGEVVDSVPGVYYY